MKALDSQGNTIYVPYRFYLIEDGNLKRYVSSPTHDRLANVYASRKKDNVKIVPIDSYKPFIGSVWTVYAYDIGDYIVANSSLPRIGGPITLVYTFNENGTVMLTAREVPGEQPYSVQLENGSLLLYDTKQKFGFHFSMTEDGDMRSDTQSVYYLQLFSMPGEDPERMTALDLAVSEKDGKTILIAGDKLTFSAAFCDPEIVNAKNKNHQVLWSAADAEGREVPDVSVSNNGVLTAKRTITDKVQLIVTARSEKYGTTAAYPVTLYPKAQKLETEPKEIQLYAGQPGSAEIRAIVTPESADTGSYQWSVSKAEIIDLQETGGNTAQTAPVQKGAVMVTVKEPGGATARVKVVVNEPVTGLRLSINGSAKPGRKVTLKAETLPATASNKTVTWSIDDGQLDIATVTERGQLTISKDAVPGTVIKVTCTAAGAPEPITETLLVTVE